MLTGMKSPTWNRFPRLMPLLFLVSMGCSSTPERHDDPVLTEVLRREAAGEPAPDVATLSLDPAVRPALAARKRVWLELASPLRDGHSARTAWLEVKGVAGATHERAYDVVVVLDVSGSTQYASGADVNENGIVGVQARKIERSRVYDRALYCSDPGDTVLDAELLALRRLIERLDPKRTRVGLVAFSDLARQRAPLGSSPQLLGQVLDNLTDGFGAGATDLAHAIRVGTRVLLDASPRVGPKPASRMLLLSDGEPTKPAPSERAAQEAIAAARDATEAGVQITAFALGPDDPATPDVMAEVAALSDTAPIRLARPGDIVHLLPSVDLASIANVSVMNVTTGEAARALRTRPDGRFDAFVRLSPGANRLRFDAEGLGGQVASVERIVHFDRSASDSASLARVQDALQRRTLELELEREIREAHQRRELELRVEE